MGIELIQGNTLVSPESSKPLIREVDTEVPQIGRLLWIVTSGDPKHALSIVEASSPQDKRAEESYLAWETVRTGDRGALVVGNIIQNGDEIKLPLSGFEGYFAGLDLDSQQIVREIALIGIRMQKAIGIDNKFKARKNLRGERVDLGILSELSGIFGAEIARLKVRDNYESFRSETISGVRRVSDISYRLDFDAKNNAPQFGHRIVVPYTSVSRETRVNLSPEELSGWFFAADIGKVGYPILRRSLGEVSPQKLFQL